MARLESAAKIKASGQRRPGMGNGAPLQKVPRPGSRLREMYDLLQAHKGEPVDLSMYLLSSKGSRYRALDQLRDFYGLDVRASRTGRLAMPKAMLVGEWFGKAYIDYLVTNQKTMDRLVIEVDL